ncbi:unnamed protein product, partial [marine sediment metagenome]
MEQLLLSGWAIAASIATIVAATTAVVTLIIVAVQAGAVKDQVVEMKKQAEGIKEQTQVAREQTRVDRAYDYVKRYNDPSFRPIAVQAIHFLKRQDKTPKEEWKILEDKQDPKHVELKS